MADVADVTTNPAKPQWRSALDLLRLASSFPVMLGGLLVGAVFVLTYNFILDPDVWWHIKVGETILRTHRFDTVETYSFTASGVICIWSQWLGGVLMAVAARLGGIRGIAGYQFVMGSAIVLLLYAYATMRSGNSKAGFAATAALLPFSSVFFSVRPQMLTFVFLMIMLIILERFRRGKAGTLWLLPPLFVIWVNAHAFFVVGLGVLVVHWASGLVDFRFGALEARRWRPAQRIRLELVFLLSLMGLAITPYGTQLAFSPFDIAFKPSVFTSRILEWQPMPLGSSLGNIFLGFLIVVLFAQAALGLTWRLEDLVLLIGSIAMAFVHARFLLLCTPFLAPAFSSAAARWLPPYEPAKDKPALNALLMTFVVAVVLWNFQSHSELEEKAAAQYALRAVEYLRRHPVPQPMFNTYSDGGYLIGTLAPQHKVFIDGRLGPYDLSGVFADYLYISDLGPGTVTILNSYRVQSCLLHHEPLATLLAASPEWQEIYHDKLSIVFVRRKPLLASGLQ